MHQSTYQDNLRRNQSTKCDAGLYAFGSHSSPAVDEDYDDNDNGSQNDDKKEKHHHKTCY